MSIQNESQFLTDDTLHEAYEIELKSKNGKSVRFGELVAGKGESVTTIVIFSKSLCVKLSLGTMRKAFRYAVVR